MPVLGLDTSNYTTSAAVFDGERGRNQGRLLEVRPGELGLRQSDAVFHHTRQLPQVMAELGGAVRHARAIGVSNRPRDAVSRLLRCRRQVLQNQNAAGRQGAFNSDRGSTLIILFKLNLSAVSDRYGARGNCRHVDNNFLVCRRCLNGGERSR